MHRPKWMGVGDFAQFVQHYAIDGVIKCAHEGCGAIDTTDTIVVDHIVPRVEHGSDELSNLQPLCELHNWRKNRYPDDAWRRHNYFDEQINQDNLRVGQNDFAMGPILDHKEFFSRPYSAINGVLFNFTQCVGAGKTLAMFAIPFALNMCANRLGIGRPRVKRMLIVTKGRDLRDQIVQELKTETISYKIIGVPPTVKCIERQEQFMDGSLDDCDIGVMCPNMLWQTVDENDAGDKVREWQPCLPRVLSLFQLVIFDENHYGHANIRRYLKVATNQLVMGVTASPITSAGELLKDMVKMSEYGYQEACINDGSMKEINFYDIGDEPPPESEDDFLNSLKIITPENQQFLVADEDEESEQTPIGSPTVKSVALAVVEKLRRLDHSEFGKSDYYRQRWSRFIRGQKMRYEMDETYLAHAIIVVDSQPLCDDVARYLNGMFERDRLRYPRDKGWNALAVHSKSPEPFDESHPFFYYKKNQIANRNVSRIIVVKNMAQEGMNNRYACITGLAKKLQSMIEGPQRIGRNLRGVMRFLEKENIVKVQPKSHDTVYLITHEAYCSLTPDKDGKVSDCLREAVDFILYSGRHDMQYTTIDEYVEDGIEGERLDDDDDFGAKLDSWIKCSVGNFIGNLDGKRLKPTQLIKAVGAERSKKIKQNRIKTAGVNYLHYDEEEIAELARCFNPRPPKRVGKLLSSEKIGVKRITGPQCEEFMRREGLETVWEMFKEKPLFDMEEAVNQLASKIANVGGDAPMVIYQSTEALIGAMVEKFNSNFNKSFGANKKRFDVTKYVHEAIVYLFSKHGAKTIEDFYDGGILAKDEVTYELRENRESDVSSYVRFLALKDGLLPEIATVLMIKEQDGINVERLEKLTKHKSSASTPGTDLFDG